MCHASICKETSSDYFDNYTKCEFCLYEWCWVCSGTASEMHWHPFNILSCGAGKNERPSLLSRISSKILLVTLILVCQSLVIFYLSTFFLTYYMFEESFEFSIGLQPISRFIARFLFVIIGILLGLMLTVVVIPIFIFFFSSLYLSCIYTDFCE